uniref:Cilia- and flagella-associated protein 299 n=1 Tax=Musca domestica TaxID=7370 RepID=A0A1I8NF09_MUSDO
MFLLDCPGYEDYLDTFVTRCDIRFIRNVRFCRMLVELGYRSPTDIYTPEQFQQHKAAVQESLWPIKKSTIFFSDGMKSQDPVLIEMANRERPNAQKMISKAACNLISQNVIAIFGPIQGSGSDIVASICHTLEIPHFTFDWSPSEALDEKPLRSMSLNLHPYNLQFSQGLSETVQSFGWRSFTVVYESEKELQQIQDILQIGEPSSNPTTVKQLPDDSDY